MGERLYYQAPPDGMFYDIRRNAIKIWETYDNTFGYVDEKVGYIKSLKNIGDNYMVIVAMFDPHNQARLLISVKPATAKRIIKVLS